MEEPIYLDLNPQTIDIELPKIFTQLLAIDTNRTSFGVTSEDGSQTVTYKINIIRGETTYNSSRLSLDGLYSIKKELIEFNYVCSINTNNPHDFIDKLKDLLVNLDIKNNLCDIIKDEDIPNMIKHIKKEVYPLYPVPRYFSDEELINIFNKIRNIA